LLAFLLHRPVRILIILLMQKYQPNLQKLSVNVDAFFLICKSMMFSYLTSPASYDDRFICCLIILSLNFNLAWTGSAI
ncbi:MAG: hypothetical protein JXB00_13105, partial [Bacteroidales bacterium]|nr:hypothetical protein [Bacteroidales bacterium]